MEQVLASPAAGGDRLVDAARRQQRAYLVAAVHPDWLPAVLAEAPAALRPVIQSNATAAYDIGQLNGVLPTIPPWRIVAPAAVETLAGWYREAEARYGVPWQYLAAINFVETDFGRIVGDSSAGAQGPMQFLPSTWAQYGDGDVHDPHAAILAAGRFLRAAGAPASIAGAVHAYNPSDLYVAAVTLYAQRIAEDGRALPAYHAWQVEVQVADGYVVLPEGYSG